MHSQHIDTLNKEVFIIGDIKILKAYSFTIWTVGNGAGVPCQFRFARRIGSGYFKTV